MESEAAFMVKMCRGLVSYTIGTGKTEYSMRDLPDGTVDRAGNHSRGSPSDGSAAAMSVRVKSSPLNSSGSPVALAKA